MVVLNNAAAYLRNLLGGGNHLGAAFEVRHHVVHAHLHAAAQVHRVQPRRHALAALAEDGAREDRRRRGAFATNRRRSVSDLEQVLPCSPPEPAGWHRCRHGARHTPARYRAEATG